MYECLFSQHTIQDGIQDIHLSDGQLAAAKEWMLVRQSKKGERELYLDFTRHILIGVLGYEPDSIIHETGRIEFQITDRHNNPLVYIECKAPKFGLDRIQSGRKPGHKTPTTQLWSYMVEGNPPPKYGIVTNYTDFRLIIYSRGRYATHDIAFDNSEEDTIKEFVYVFGLLLRDEEAEALHDHSFKHDIEIADRFYDLFYDTRTRLVDEFKPALGRRKAVAAAQTFLNRLLFVRFAEDHGLSGSTTRLDIDKIISHGMIGEHTANVLQRMVDIFEAYDKGSAHPVIHRFNGGLFANPTDRNVPFRDMVRDAEHGRVSPSLLPKSRMGVSKTIQNIQEMCSYNFRTALTVNIMGHIFERSVFDMDEIIEGTTAKAEGIYYTPEPVTGYICRNAIVASLSRDKPARSVDELLEQYDDELHVLEYKFKNIKILDPACGSGAFLTKAAEVLLEIAHSIYDAKLEKGICGGNSVQEMIEDMSEEQEMGRIVRQNLYGIDKNGESASIARLALFLITAHRRERLPDLDNIKTGDSLNFDWEREFPGVVFDVVVGNPPYVRQESMREKPDGKPPAVLDAEGVVLSPRSDYSSYFFLQSLGRLRTGGMLGFITTGGWMHAGYGKNLQHILLEKCRLDTLVKMPPNVFDADVTTIVAIMERDGSPAGVRTAQVADARRTGAIRYKTIQQKSIKPGNWNLLFAERVHEPRIGMVRMSETGILKRGITTGHNGFFVLNGDDLKKHKIAKKYTLPAVSGSMRGGLLSNAKEYLLNVQDSKRQLAKTAAGRRMLEYIEAGEATMIKPKKGTDTEPRPISELGTVGSHTPWWYSLDPGEPPDIFLTRFADRRMKIYENDGRFYATDNFACFAPHDKSMVHAFLAYLSSSWFMYYMEMHGRPAGAGALQMLMADYKEAPVPNFDRMSGADTSRMSGAWLAYRESFDLAKLDDTVFDVLGFDMQDRRAILEETELLSKQRRQA